MNDKIKEMCKERGFYYLNLTEAFTGEDGSRYAVTLEDEDTLALKFYLDGEESYMSLVNTVYFARQEAMG